MSGRTELSLVALGGLGEFGRNVLWLSSGDSNLVVDAGVSFPDETFPGIDRIAPDLSPLRNVRVDAIVLTHGHEDHVGSLPLLAEWCEAPVYGLPFTLALARRRLEEAGLPAERLVEVRRGESLRAGAFALTFFRVSHSVPDSAAILIEAGGWRLLHSGDFKLDPDPPDGETTDSGAIARAASAGIDLALVDSTNAERPGRALSERVAGAGLAAAFADAPGRIVLTTFSSHVARISQAADAAIALGRRVSILGRSMRNVAEIAERFGRLRLSVDSRIAAAELAEMPRRQVLCLMGGSQGEPFSALYRLALDEHADVRLDSGDLVLFSARTIPGHERSVNRVIDHLVRRGARVLRETEPPIHVSGHGHREDLRDWLALSEPRAVLPVHGETRMLAAAAEIARERGIPADRVPLLENGDRLTLSLSGLRVERGAVATGKIFLDSRPEMVDLEVVRDRRRLAEEGFIVVLVQGREIAVVSRGVARDESGLASEVSRAARGVLEGATPEERSDVEWLRSEIALAAKRACRREFGIRPVIVPVIV
ncbi:MAG TPA: ribonuclease J [Thermoanaerobaculia bacterium]|nr:ribonuclease J [Thermoanaerobaculia bacterium]